MKISRKLLSLILTLCMLASAIVPFSASAAGEDKETADSETVDVTDFGADPTGATDSAEAVQQAVAKAKEISDSGKSVTLLFPEGRYDFYPDHAEERALYISNTVGDNQTYKNKKIGILLEGINNITIDGDNSLFMFHGKMTTIACIDCDGVTYQDFDIDFQVPTVVDVTVEKVENNTATLYIPECYNYEVNSNNHLIVSSDASPYDGHTYWTFDCNTAQYTQRYDEKEGITWRGNTNTKPAFNNISSMEDLHNHRVKVTYGSTPDSEVRPGVSFQMRNTVRDHSGAFFWKSKDIVLQRIDIHFLHGFGMVGQSSENITLDDVDFETEKGKGTTSASSADFIQMSGCKGDIEIKNCTFSNPHDDPINIHGTFEKIIEISQDRTRIRVQFQHNETKGFQNYFEGDEIEFVSQDTLLPVGGTENPTLRTVTQVDGPDGADGEVGEGNNGSLSDTWLTLDEPVPDGVTVEGNYVVENVTWTPNAYIHDNIFKETPTRGILVTTMGEVKIEDNVFDGLGMSSIYISDDASGWYESGRTTDVTITGNVFTRSQGSGNIADILVEPTKNPGKDTPIHGTMTIKDNTFFCTEKAYVLNMRSVAEVIFENNRIYRENPGVTLNATVNNNTMAVGSTQKISVSGIGTQLNHRAYNFESCKKVTMVDNMYDGGINANIQASGMTNGDFDVSEDQAAVGTTSTAHTQNTGTRNYFESSDPNVVKVSANGDLTALTPGTATITVYSVAGDRRYDATPITITVNAGDTTADKLPTGIHFSDPDQHHDIVTVGGDNKTYSVEVEGEEGEDLNDEVTWHVYDSETLQDTDKATINEETGELHAVHGGVVTVVASTVNGLEARDFVVIHENGLYTLADNFKVHNPSDGHYRITEDGKVQIDAINGGLWATQTPHDIIVGDFPSETNQATVTATVKMEGKPTNGWDEAGLIFYTDDNNYVEIQRKRNATNAQATINVVNESSSNPDESNHVNDDLNNETVYLKLQKDGNQITGYYSTNGTSWTNVGNAVTNANLGNNFKIGFSVGSGTKDNEASSQPTFTFSELKLNNSEENEVITEEASAGEITEVPALDYDAENNTVSVDADSALSDPNSKAIVKWGISDTKTGHYDLIESVSTEELTTTADMKDKYIKAAIVPVKNDNITGSIYHTEPVQITGDGAEYAGKYAKAVATLTAANFTGLTSNFAAFNTNTQYYYTTALTATKNVSYSFTKGEDDSTIEIIVNGEKVKIPDTESNTVTGSIELLNAQNVVEVNVTAAGGVTTVPYRFVISREGDNNSKLATLKVGSESIPLTDNVYSYTLNNQQVGSKKVTYTVTNNSTPDIVVTKDGKICEDGTVALTPGPNIVTIIVTPETHSVPTYYTVNIKIPDPSSAYLESVTFGGAIKIKEAFNRKTTKYTGSATNSTVSFTAVAEEPDATVTASINGESLESTGNTCGGDLTLKRGANTLTITVTSPDKENTKEYTYTITGIPSVYLSDLDWDSSKSTCGWDQVTITKDAEVQTKGAISLKVDGTNRTFERGVTSHAPSHIYYNIEGLGFNKFECYVGVDTSMTSQGTISCTIKIDDQVVKTTGTLSYSGNAMFISIPIPKDASELDLYADVAGDGNGGDHVDWADAKFFTVFNEDEGTVDKSALEAKIAEASAIEKGNYTDASFAALTEAVTAGQAVLDNANATQDEVDAAAQAISDAIDGLTEGTVDKSALEAKIAEASAIEKGNYTDESFAALTEAVTAGQAVLDNANATQDEVDAAAQAISDAIDGLTENPGEIFKLGNVDHSKEDGADTINATDATLVLQYFAKIITDESKVEFDKTLADVSNDKEINATDATLILQYFAKIITVFPAEKAN